MRFLRSVLTLTATLLISCVDPSSTRDAIQIYISPAGLNLVVGDQGLLIARAVDIGENTVVQPVFWSSSNPAVASIDQRLGRVTAASVGTVTMTATVGTLTATATVSVRNPGRVVALSVVPTTLSLFIGSVAPLAAIAVDSSARTLPVSIEWVSEDAAVASVGRTTGVITGLSVGTTTITAATGDLRATAVVTVVGPGTAVAQWATGATASSEYAADAWSALQATGSPNVTGCADDPRAWASAHLDLDWLEVSFEHRVRPSEIRIHEVWGVGAVVKVEVKDAFGRYYSVYTPPRPGGLACPRVLSIPITSVLEMVGAVRITVNQSHDWAEIDAVQLIGKR